MSTQPIEDEELVLLDDSELALLRVDEVVRLDVDRAAVPAIMCIRIGYVQSLNLADMCNHQILLHPKYFFRCKSSTLS